MTRWRGLEKKKKKKQEIIVIEKLEQENIWHFSLKNDLNDKLNIILIADFFLSFQLTN